MALKTRALVGALAALFAAGPLALPEAGSAAAAPPVRGEMARLQRQIYDWAYRNSNNNVFRNSRHFHPTQNPFRSSEHYKQRLAASFDGYPLRTTETVRRRVGDREFVETYEYVHPRRHPAGPSPSEAPYGYVDPYLDGFPEEIVADQYAALEPVEEPQEKRIRSRDDIEMVPVRTIEPPARPKRSAVIRREVLEDGSVRVVITNE